MTFSISSNVQLDIRIEGQQEFKLNMAVENECYIGRFMYSSSSVYYKQMFCSKTFLPLTFSLRSQNITLSCSIAFSNEKKQPGHTSILKNADKENVRKEDSDLGKTEDFLNLGKRG